jgi:hypothetical protein
MRQAILIWLVLTSLAIAQPKAVIDGPKSGATGDLIVLDGSQSVGDGHRWVMPTGLQTLGCGADAWPGQIAFASGKAGVYTFQLIVADKTAAIDYTMHTVTIGGATEPVEPGPVDPTPTPVPELEKLEKLSYESASRLADSATAKGLADSILAVDAQISAMCSRQQCPTLQAAQAMMVAAIEQRLLERTGASRNVNWLDGWRKPMNEAISKMQGVDVPKYQAIMRAMAAGLSKAQ